MEKFLKKNIRYISLLLLFLLCIKTFQSCTRKMTINNNEKKYKTEIDSVVKSKDNTIFVKNNESDSLKNEITTRDFLIKDLTNELKIAGVKVNAAERRANAVQQTAEKVKTNTTIQVRGVERDTVKILVKDTLNKENKIDEKIKY